MAKKQSTETPDPATQHSEPAQALANVAPENAQPSFSDLERLARKRGNKPIRVFTVKRKGNGDGEDDLIVGIVKTTNRSKAKLFIADTMLEASEATFEEIYDAGQRGVTIQDATKVSVR